MDAFRGEARATNKINTDGINNNTFLYFLSLNRNAIMASNKKVWVPALYKPPTRGKWEVANSISLIRFLQVPSAIAKDASILSLSKYMAVSKLKPK